jgi:hypothetical protein
MDGARPGTPEAAYSGKGDETGETDCPDGRLTIVLRYVSEERRWQSVEQDLGIALVPHQSGPESQKEAVTQAH